MYYAHLTRSQRYQIEQLLQENCSVSCIARKLHVHRSTIYRELRRGGHSRQGYRGWYAQEAAERRARRSAANHPVKPAALWQRVRIYLRSDWSPEQIRGWLDRFGQPTVSAAAIYAHVRADRARGGTLHQHLRYGRRRRKWGSGAGGLPKGRPSIHQRPRYVAKRAQLGHWEGDTFTGSNSRHHTLTLVERKSRFVLLRHPRRAYSEYIARNAIRALRAMPLQSITFDNGTQFAQYSRIAKELACRVYFADPGRPHQRATCENTIGLIRQYIPKGSSGRYLSAHQIQSIADKLNHRPRKCLGFKTPAEVLLNAKPPVALRS